MRRITRNRKGFLLAEETLKIVIAVISVGFLVYFLYSLYFSGNKNQELEQAKASLDFLVEQANAGVEDVQIFNPEGWVLISWPYEGEEQFPDSCSGKSCICITEDILAMGIPLSSGDFANQNSKFLEQLNKKDMGYCLESEFKVQGFILSIENPPITLSINDGIIKREDGL